MSFAHFERAGVALRYEVVGKGPPVIFQHGLGGDAAQVAEVFPSAPRVRRITLECRAHGGSQSGSLSKLSIGTFTEDVAALADRLRLKRSVAGGISMGAAIAFRLAVKRPDLVYALVLSRPAWLFAPAPDNMQPIALVADLLRKHALPIAREIFEQSDVAKRLARDAPNNLVSLRGFFANHDPATRAALLGSIVRDGPGVTESEARSIAVPTLVIGTAEDTIHPLSFAETLAGIIPGARFVRITSKSADQSRHTAEFRAALSEFLREVAV
ncbi:MAG TPA: alpha/beta hydrolase [Bauldia sp.]|nr:alpha/beta hydrolase [Bauldia sp.]